MIFSKKTLFAAAMFAGSMLVASAANDDYNASGLDTLWNSSVQGNINIDTNLEIVVTPQGASGGAYTLNGSFLSSQGAIFDTWDPALRGFVFTEDAETVKISGGGTLEYAGTVGSSYYTTTYTLNRGDKHPDPNAGDATDLILSAWKGYDNFLTGGVFTGTVLVEGAGTTLNMKGQLVQYVGLYDPQDRDAQSPVSSAFSKYVGASVELKGGAVLSFEESTLNLAGSRLSFSPLAERVNALNFVKNLKSDASSTVRIGTDPGSHNRIVLYTDTRDRSGYITVNGTAAEKTNYDYTGNEISTVGRLAGNGRFYVVGEGAVAFIGQSELNPGEETTGNTWSAYESDGASNRLADIVIDNFVSFVGANIYGQGGSASWRGEISMLTDSEALNVAVDNVFANATAVQLGTTGQATGDYVVSGNQVVAGASNASAPSGSVSVRVSETVTYGVSDVSLVTVYGDQIFNNFQSLWLERSALLDDASRSDASLKEAFLQSWQSGSVIQTQRGTGKSLRVGGGSVLTINQEKGRDGWFAGHLITRLNESAQEHKQLGLDDNGDGLIVKTGAGTIFYDRQMSGANAYSPINGYLSRLLIEEGTWITTPQGVTGTAVEVGAKGGLEFLVDATKATFSGLIKGGGSLELSRFAYLENDLTTESLQELKGSGSDVVWSPTYRRYIVNYLDASAAGMQFATEQSLFTGTIVVNDGLQLILGETGAKSPSIFSSAEGIVLRGVNASDARYQGEADILGHTPLENYDGSSLQRATLELLSGVQLVRNLVGDANYSAVNVEQGATLVLTRTNAETSYAGTISGNGNLVNLGGSQAINSSGGDIFGAVSVLSGAVFVSQINANGGFSGLVLANGSTASFASQGYARVGALIGAADTSVSVAGDFTVGVADVALSGVEGGYFATARYGNYDSYFAGTSRSQFFETLKQKAEASRGGKFTNESTLAYLKNPAKLIYTTDENVYDGAFSKIFASTKYNAATSSDTVLLTMANGAGAKNSTRYDFVSGNRTGDKLFDGEKTAAVWLRKVFSTESVSAFLASNKAQLSSAMKDSLLALSEQIASGEEGVCAYLDGTNPKVASLNVTGWNKIVAAGGLEYLKSAYPDAGFDKMPDETLYSVITNFYPSGTPYQFQITNWNVEQIGKIYGVELTNPDYEDLKAAFGNSGTDFAGTLSGRANLIKDGPETLELTGVNTYSGKTIVGSGELRVDYDAIPYTAGIDVKSGALLTINATKDMIADNHRDPETGELPDDYNLDTVGSVFSQDSTARISGTGVILKVGDGIVDLGGALLDASDVDFTGTFLVAEGGLVATVDADARTPGFNIILNATSTYNDADNTLIPASFELVFARSEEVKGGVLRLADQGAVNLAFDGSIEGKGTFILDAGTSWYKSGELFEFLGNNSLVVSSDRFSPESAEIKSGTLHIDVPASGSTASVTTMTLGTKRYVLGANADLEVDLSADATVAGSEIIGDANGWETLRVFATALDLTNAPDGTVYKEQSLTLDKTVITGLDAIDLVGGAKLVIGNLDGTASEAEKTISLKSVTMGNQAALSLAGDRTIELSGDESILSGAFTGTGTLVFSGKKLVLGSDVADGPGFSGTLNIVGSATVELNAGGVVEFGGLSVVADAGEAVTLVKGGAGTVKISEGSGNRITVGNLSVDVQSGTLDVGAGLFTVQPSSVNIEKGATFRFSDPLNTFSFNELSSLSGEGTLSFETSVSAEVTASGNIDSDFTGIINIGENVKLTLDGTVTEFAAFSGSGEIVVGSGDLTVTVNSNESGAQKFDGTITGLKNLTVVGDGALVFDTVPTGLDANKITVGSKTQSGGLGVSSAWTGTIDAVGASTTVILTGTSDFGGKVVVGDGVSNLTLLKTGAIDCSQGNAIADAFRLKTADGQSELVLSDLESALSVTLGNVAGTDLELKNVDKLSENINLKTNADGDGKGELVFSKSASGAQGSLRANTPVDAGVTVWDKDISGDGSITVSTDLQLGASVLSYKGATTVTTGNKLIYGAAQTVSYSSKLEVESGATVEGGVRLVGEKSDVFFNNGATFVFTGETIAFTGTAEVSGKLNVVLDEDALSVRGTPIALFDYIGTESPAGKNTVTFDSLNINSTQGLLYYKDLADPATTGSTVIYVVAPDLAEAGADLHEGTSSGFVEMLNDITATNAGELQVAVGGLVLRTGRDNSVLTSVGKLAEAIIKTPNGALAGALNNLSPLSYGAMLALPQSGFINDMSAISSRIEQRRYDSYTQFAWEIHDDWEFFAQAQGALAESDEGSDARTFDMNTYGASAGMDVKMNAETVAGFSFSYDYGKADIHNGGGDIESHDVRATAFIGKLFADRFYLDAGAQIGYAMFDVKRNTLLGGVDGDTNGWHAGAFANLGMLVPLLMSEDEKTSLNLMPYIGLAYSYYGIGAFDESGADTALDTDAFGASSLRATVGASLALVTPFLGKNTRTNLDLAYTRELMDSEVDIDYSMPGISGNAGYTASAIAFAEDTFSVGPRFSYDLDRNNSIYAGYRFEFSTDSDTAHSVNLGFRSRF